MLKILIFHHCDSWGGAGLSLIYCCKILMNRYNVSVCLPHIDSEVGRELCKLDGLRIISLEDEIAMVSAYNGGPKWYSRTFWKNYFKIRFSKLKINEILDKEKYNLVLSNSITLSWISKYANRKGIKNVCYIRETQVANIGFWISKSFLKKYCDGVLFISNYDRDTMKIRVRVQDVIPDIVEFEDKYTDNYAIQEEDFVVVYLGGDEYIKGYPTIKKMMQGSSANDFSLVIAGNVKDSEKIINSKVKYVGNVTDVGEIISKSDVVLFPSLVGHQARPIFEAGALRKPVIVSDYPQTKENVIDGYNGLEFKPGDSDMLLKKIYEMKYKYNYVEMGRNNYELYKANHSYEGCKEKMLAFVDGVISNVNND